MYRVTFFEHCSDGLPNPLDLTILHGPFRLDEHMVEPTLQTRLDVFRDLSFLLLRVRENLLPSIRVTSANSSDPLRTTTITKSLSTMFLP